MTDIPAARVEKKSLGIALMLGASMMFAMSDAVSKLAVSSLPPLEVSWMRSVVVIAMTLPTVIWRKGTGILRSAHPRQQLMRGLTVTGSSLMFITGLSYVPLADATAINFIWPVLITVFSAIFLGEKVGIRRSTATLAGFIGMLIIVRPGSSAFQAAALLSVGAAVLWAIATLMTRHMSADEPPETTIVWSALIMLAATSLALPFCWVTPSASEIGYCLLIGIGSGFGHAMVIFALKQARASSLAQFSYSQLVWAVFLGYFMFGTIPDMWIGIGSLIIVASGIYTIHRERVLQRTA